MRWVQRLNEETGKYEMVPRDEAARRVDMGHAVHGDIQAFVSPVDGSVISDRKALREHNKRNGVVSAGEFSKEFYEGKAKERADFYEGKHSRQETLERKREIYETMVKAERNHN